jgi:CRISPR-associated endonuclease/helicase Cas3
MNYDEFFKKATDNPGPYPYQRRLATGEDLPQLLDIPTGCGKTAAAVLAWIWRRRFSSDEIRENTPRRLVYCLPMRVLVEQTRDNCIEWLKNLGLLAIAPGDKKAPQSDNRPVDDWAAEHGDDGDRIAVTVLMGGEDKDEWDLYPERDAIIIGTQDMLLSRALNRGYGMSKYRWPMHFGLLNNDCLWVMDEVQLMGVGVETTSQMNAFRRKLDCFGNSKSIWMSATTDPEQLNTVDREEIPKPFRISVEDMEMDTLRNRKEAPKRFHKIDVELSEESSGKDYFTDISNRILDAHVDDTLTLVIVNTVKRAVEVYKALKKNDNCPGRISLIHSRFRQIEREERLKILDETGSRIIVSTQVVEAGVDIDARTLFTELAPWPSMVQRFGRCNRKGEHDVGDIVWIDMEEKFHPPYDDEEMKTSRKISSELDQVSLMELEEVDYSSPFVVRPVIRRKDLLELFDTTPDLSGNDLDISRYVRETEDNDVQVFWRDFAGDPPEDMKRPARDELCSVSVGDIKKFLGRIEGFLWDPLDSTWTRISGESIRPGVIILLRSENGGYDPELGWTGQTSKKGKVEPFQIPEDISSNESNDSDRHTYTGEWKTIPDHCREVSEHVGLLSDRMGLDDEIREALRLSGLWHDVGKAHEAFQNVLPEKPDDKILYAKSKKYSSKTYFVMDEGKEQERRHFRHELASALAYWKYSEGDRNDLVTYLIAAHHGKVRQSIRSLPGENEPGDRERLFARGIWNGDRIPDVPGIMKSGVELDLSPMIMGKGSWLEMSIGLLEKWGPFKLAFMEALMKASDENVSRTMEEVSE